MCFVSSPSLLNTAIDDRFSLRHCTPSFFVAISIFEIRHPKDQEYCTCPMYMIFNESFEVCRAPHRLLLRFPFLKSDIQKTKNIVLVRCTWFFNESFEVCRIQVLASKFFCWLLFFTIDDRFSLRHCHEHMFFDVDFPKSSIWHSKDQEYCTCPHCYKFWSV